MGQPRASRRKVVAVSSDEEDDVGSRAVSPNLSNDDAPSRPQKRATGKLKSVKKSKPTEKRITATASQDASLQVSPGKQHTSKTKSKTAVKDQPKANGRPIYSFFNATTERQRTSQPSASPEKPLTPHDEPEIIQDDSGDDKGSSLQLAKGSSIALAMRKRKLPRGDSLEIENGLPPPASQKFRKTSAGDRVPSFPVINEDKRPWTDQFAPLDLSELAVHKRKVTDVRHWLETTLSGKRQRVLMLKGPAGTAKTTAIRLLARELGLNVLEWKNPIGTDLSSESTTSGASQFEDFVATAGKATGLQFSTEIYDSPQMSDQVVPTDAQLTESSRKLLLIEEFPNTYSRSSSTLQSFRSTVLQYLSSPNRSEGGPIPIVLVVSETLLSTNTALADSFTAHRLLGPVLTNHPFLDTIEFNPIAPTILIKALETIVIKEARKSGRRSTPGIQVLKHLSESGDIRSAVSSFEFLCLRGDDGDTWSNRITFTKQKKAKTGAPLTKAEEDALKLVSNRESTLGIFHAVGKVVYNKRVETRSTTQPPSWLPHHRRNKVPENDVDTLINELGTDTSTFVAALHENYALSCSTTSREETLDSLTRCIDNISDADLLSMDRFSFGTKAFASSSTDSIRQDELAAQAAVRGLLFSLPSPVHRSVPTDGKRGDANLMFYPSSLKLWKQREELEGILELLVAKSDAEGVGSPSAANRDDPASKLTGVESWKRANRLGTPPRDIEAGEAYPTTRSHSTRVEMLVERLPYLREILDARRVSSKFMEQLTAVTRIRGIIDVNPEDEAEADGDGNDPNTTEGWATDKPDAEAIARSNTSKLKSRRKDGKITEGGGLGIPVEKNIEKLVLEDDDIEDY